MPSKSVKNASSKAVKKAAKKVVRKQQVKLESTLLKMAKAQAQQQRELKRIEKEESAIVRNVRAIDDFEGHEKILLQRLESEQRKLEETEHRILSREDDILSRIDASELDVNETVLKAGPINISRAQFINVTRAAAGAFLGFGLSIRFYDVFAATLSNVQFVMILVFVLLLSGVLIFMRERTEVTKRGIMHVLGRIATLYIICLFVEIVSFAIFGMLPLNNLPLLAEMLVVGTYVTMAGAVAFSLI